MNCFWLWRPRHVLEHLRVRRHHANLVGHPHHRYPILHSASSRSSHSHRRGAWVWTCIATPAFVIPPVIYSWWPSITAARPGPPVIIGNALCLAGPCQTSLNAVPEPSSLWTLLTALTLFAIIQTRKNPPQCSPHPNNSQSSNQSEPALPAS